MENNEVVILNLDRPRALRLTNRVLKRFCAGQKVSLTELETAIQRYDVMIALVYEMLRADDPALTPDACDDLLDAVSIGEVIEACSQAIAAGFENGKKTAGDPTKTPAPSIG